MTSLRFTASGQINKPLPSALVKALPAIKDAVTNLQSLARKINEGKKNEEPTNTVVWGSESDHISFALDLAIPMPLSQALQDKIPSIRTKIRQLKDYAVNTGEAAFSAKYHVCYHGEGGNHPPCNPEEI